VISDVMVTAVPPKAFFHAIFERATGTILFLL